MCILNFPEFKDRIVVITGAAQGIGLVSAMAFLKNGATVLVLDNDSEAIDDAREDFLKDFENVFFYECELSDSNVIKDVCEDIGKRFGRVDILVNNAAAFSSKPISQRPVEEWEYVIKVNLTAPYLMTKFLLPYMKEGSCIVNIASTRALMSEPNTEPYSASKGGILALTHSLAVSLSPNRIRVNAISPGWIETSEFKKKGQRSKPLLRDIDHLQHPAGRVGTPFDIANAILFLTSQNSSFITGTNLVVDGGMTIKMIYEE